MKKKSSLRERISVISFIFLILSGAYIFFCLMSLVPLTIILGAAIVYFHTGSTEILSALPNFIRLWIFVISIFSISTIIFILSKYFRRKE